MLGEILRWTATACGVVAAILVAMNLGRRITGIGFVVFTAASILWTVAGALAGLPSLVALNVVLTAVNLLGVYRWLVAKR